jgi:DNA polymerase IV
MKKFISHLDLDCFFVSVERLNDSSLAGIPVAVGGSPGGRGVISSASYEARKFGVRSAMPTGRALRLCPQLRVVGGHHRQYSEISSRLHDRMTEIAPVVEQASIDEMYMDFTGCETLYGGDLAGMIVKIQAMIREEFSLPCTISLASNKLVAKIATDTVKPAGHIYVQHGTEEEFLAPLPIGVIPGIGKKTELLLRAKGFNIVGDLQRVPPAVLVKLLGAHGEWIERACHGRGSDSLSTEHDQKSISREETFAQDLNNSAELERICFELIRSVCGTLRKKGLRSKTVTLKLRTPDFVTTTHRATVEPTNDDGVVFSVVRSLLASTPRSGGAIRLVGVGLSNFGGAEQEDLFGDTGKRDKALEAVDKLRQKFGPDSIITGSA